MNSSCLLYTPNSGNSYYFRSRIPKDLSHHFGGLSEFRLSLKCAIKSHAQRITKSLGKIVSEIYEDIRQGMKSLEIEDIKEILRIEIRKQILHAHRVYEGTDRWNEEGIERSLDSISKKEMNLKQMLRSDLKSYKGKVDSKLEDILESLNIKVDINSLEFSKLRNNFIDLFVMRHEWMKELVNQTGRTDDQFRRDAELKLGMGLFPDISNQSEFTQTVQTPVKTTIAPIHQKDSGETLVVTLKRYIDRKRLEKISPKSLQEDESVIAEFVEIIGEMNASQMTKKEVNHYIDVQSKLPPNRKKSPKYRDHSISELVEKNLPENETQTNQNINKRLTKLTTFGHWCIKQGLISSNPFKDMKLSVRKTPPKKRVPFSVKELREILKPEIYLDWTINYKHPIYNEGGAKNGMPYYWIFPLGILSGMRTNEMCQLRCSDIREEKRGMWFIYIEESEETKVKTENSIRKIPVHPTLKELGFIDFVGKLRRKKKDRVFWELTQTRDGYAKRVSRHFNEKYLPAVGVWEKNVKVLYCTRHTFINCLYSKGVEENVIKALVGHEKEFTMKHYGGDPFTPEQLLQEISKVSYSGINWKGLKVL